MAVLFGYLLSNTTIPGSKLFISFASVFLGWCPLPLLEGLSCLGFVWDPGLYCYLLGRFFLPLDVYIQCNCFLFSIVFR